MRMKVPQLTIATAIILCHRFFLRQSHGKHDRTIIATSCLFLASKVKETPRSLEKVILISYEIIHKFDPKTVQGILGKEGVYEEQRELIIHGEKLVLETLDFDLSVNLPYKPLVEAIRKFKISNSSALAQVAWNFVNDGLRTSLCLQLKPNKIAAGAVFLAAKFLKIKLPYDGQRSWWQEFDVTSSQLEEFSRQILELYEQTKPIANSDQANPLATGEITNSHTNDGSLKGFERRNVEDKYQEGHQDLEKNIDDQKLEKGEIIVQQNISKVDVEEKIEREPKTVGGKEMETFEGVQGDQPILEVLKKKTENKVKAALEKRRKLGPNTSSKDTVFMDENELIEMLLENGIEL